MIQVKHDIFQFGNTLYYFTNAIKAITFLFLQEIKPTLDELGILTPEEIGYDQPELGMPSPFEIH